MLDSTLSIIESIARSQEPLDGECIDISDDEALPSDPAKDALLRKLQDLQARLRATAPTAALPAMPSVPALPSLTGSAMDNIETRIDLEEPLEPFHEVPSEAPETIEEKPSESAEPIEEKPSEEPVVDDLLSATCRKLSSAYAMVVEYHILLINL